MNQNRGSEADSDGAAIEAVLAGDRERFGAIVGRYHRALLRLAESRLGRPDWAEEAVQETFLAAFKSLRSYDSRYSFRTWLWTILLNQCRRHYERRSRRGEVDGTPKQAEFHRRAARSVESGETPPAQAARRERGERLRSLLERLPPAQADALRLRFYGGLKFHEIAEVQDCSLSSAKNRVRLGLAKMSQWIEPSEIHGDAT